MSAGGVSAPGPPRTGRPRPCPSRRTAPRARAPPRRPRRRRASPGPCPPRGSLTTCGHARTAGAETSETARRQGSPQRITGCFPAGAPLRHSVQVVPRVPGGRRGAAHRRQARPGPQHGRARARVRVGELVLRHGRLRVGQGCRAAGSGASPRWCAPRLRTGKGKRGRERRGAHRGRSTPGRARRQRRGRRRATTPRRGGGRRGRGWRGTRTTRRGLRKRGGRSD